MAETWQLVMSLFTSEGIRPKRSNMHLLVPFIIICLLVLLAIIILIQRAIRCKKENKPFFALKGYRFFANGFDPIVFFATISLMIIYFIIMPHIHFMWASIIILFLLNLLYTRPFSRESGVNVKSVGISAVISIVAPVLIYLIFGVAFKLTLP